VVDFQPFVARALEAGRMSITKSNVTFEVLQLKDGSGYFVLVTWPNGMEQQVYDFANAESAQFWIEHQTDAWLARHPWSH
jgi:hypothetical protein